jgi:hypothetical protein
MDAAAWRVEAFVRTVAMDATTARMFLSLGERAPDGTRPARI